MSIFVKLIHLSHHSSTERYVAISTDEVIIYQTSSYEDALEFINHHEWFITWFKVMTTKFLVEVVKNREVTLVDVVYFFVPVTLFSPLLRCQVSVVWEEILFKHNPHCFSFARSFLSY